jgi:saccharopine dehydrogenase-like NADP-dependent oxidoreductase
MPPLIIWGVGLLGSAVIARLAMREARRINRELEEARQARAATTEPAKTLRLDPRTGAYRPQ